MYEKELKSVWTQAVDNEQNEDSEGFFHDRKINVNGVVFLFDVDGDNAIYYTPVSKVMDDLVYAKTHPKGHDVQEVLQTFDEFKNRVEEIASDLQVRE